MKLARLTCAVIALVGALGLQAAEVSALVAQVPFAFYVGNEQLPPGRYNVESAAPGVLWVRDRAQRTGTNVQMIPARPKQTHERALLVFHKYGEKYFLREIWQKGVANGAKIPTGRRERELLQAAAPERVHVWLAAYHQ